MAKEMIVSSNSHETKIAILEDDQVAELYFEREKSYTLAGSIYKGRVTRVLPGMQSAFVDIGLERDAFLYVSDFLEDTEEYDRIAATVEQKVTDMDAKTSSTGGAEAQGARMPLAPVEAEPSAAEAPGELAATAAPAGAAPSGEPRQEGDRDHRSRFSRRSRRRRGRSQKDFPDSKYASANRPPAEAQAAEPAAPSAPPQAKSAEPEPPVVPIILPGESLAKYRDRGPSDSYSRRAHEPQRRDDTTRTEAASAGASPASDSSDTSSASKSNPELRGPESSREEPRGTPLTWETMSGFAPKTEATAKEDVSVVSITPAPEALRSETASPEPPKFLASEAALSAEAPSSSSASPYGSDFPLENVVSADYVEDSREAMEEVAGADFEDLPEGSPAEEAAGTEGPEGEQVAAEGGTQPGNDQPQRASVRDRNRNPRYMRKGRFGRRDREGKPEATKSAGQGQDRGRPRERVAAPQPLIADLLKEGQEIIVQIAKEPLGKKGARITSHVALPGRYLVYMPTVDHVGVSRKISSDEERQRLKRIILEHGKGIQGGFIVRTAGAGHSEEDLVQDIQYLSSLWSEMKATAEKTSAPVLLHHDLNLVLRILRDQFSTEFTSVWVDNEQEYERILGLVSKFQPALVNRVKLYSKDLPLFEEMGIQEEINKALKPKVWLKSGGYIVINQTEALVAIDINTGKYVGKSNRLEDTIVKTNTDAIREIVRQIRLRDLGGIIVIDFIDMEERKNRQKVMTALEDALRGDRSPSKILAFNEFGLVAITRKRVRQSLERSLCQPCADCGGSGLVKSIQTVSYEILSEAKKLAREFDKKQITLRVNPEVGRALKARDNTILQEIEEMARKPVIVRNDPSLHIEGFDFN